MRIKEKIKLLLAGISKNQRLLCPPKFNKLYQEYKGKEFLFLDVGCGNHSVKFTKNWFPDSKYYGVDKGIFNNDQSDFDQMEEFFDIDLTIGSLDGIPNNLFDVVMFSHVIEHLPNGLDIVGELAKKLKPGGKIYIEYPSVKSISLPSMGGNLNFCDDPTHIRVYDLKEIANVLLSNNMIIKRGGPRRNRIRIGFFPIFVIVGLLKGTPAGAFWDLLGFVDYIYAEKKGIFKKRD
jgi:SAM-dependent methyltransferase